MKKVKIKNIVDLPALFTSHGVGIKKTFIFGNESGDSLTQYAYAKLKFGEIIESHSHSSMNEYFFVHSGKGDLITDQGQKKLKKGDFFNIPKGVKHQIKISNEEDALELIYFGIAQ